MRTVSRVAAAAALALAAFAHSADAGTSTPNGDPYIGEVVTLLEAIRTDYEDGSREAKAIDAALKFFKDPSSGYAEDLLDLKNALKKLRPVFGSDVSNDPTGLVAELKQQLDLAPIVIGGLIGRAYPPIESIFLMPTLDRKSKIKNEGARLAGLAGLMKKVQAKAKKRGVDLYS